MNQRTGSIVHVVCGLAVAGAVACKREPTSTPATSGEVAAVTAGETPAGSGEAPASGGETPVDASAGGDSQGATTGAEPATTGAEPVATTGPTTTTTGTTGTVDAPPAGDGKTAPSGPEPLPAPLHAKVDEKCGKDPGVGTPAVPFTLKTPEGKELSMASLRGKVVLLNFWGTWCKPCLKELPEFDRLVRHYRKHGVVLVAVATDTEPEGVLEFGKSRKIAAKFALGGEDLAKKYDSPNFPFSFVVDDKGTIRGSYRGYKPECLGKIEQDLRASLEARKR